MPNVKWKKRTGQISDTTKFITHFFFFGSNRKWICLSMRIEARECVCVNVCFQYCQILKRVACYSLLHILQLDTNYGTCSATDQFRFQLAFSVVFPLLLPSPSTCIKYWNWNLIFRITHVSGSIYDLSNFGIEILIRINSIRF